MPQLLRYRGSMYRQAAEPLLRPPEQPPRIQHPTGGPRFSREQFVALGQLTWEDFDEIVGVIASKMVARCTTQYSNAENWCIAINGQGLGWFHDRNTAVDAAKHWLFLKSRRPNADIKIGTGPLPKFISFKGTVYKLARTH